MSLLALRLLSISLLKAGAGEVALALGVLPRLVALLNCELCSIQAMNALLKLITTRSSVAHQICSSREAMTQLVKMLHESSEPAKPLTAQALLIKLLIANANTFLRSALSLISTALAQPVDAVLSSPRASEAISDRALPAACYAAELIRLIYDPHVSASMCTSECEVLLAHAGILQRLFALMHSKDVCVACAAAGALGTLHANIPSMRYATHSGDVLACVVPLLGQPISGADIDRPMQQAMRMSALRMLALASEHPAGRSALCRGSTATGALADLFKPGKLFMNGDLDVRNTLVMQIWRNLANGSAEEHGLLISDLVSAGAFHQLRIYCQGSAGFYDLLDALARHRTARLAIGCAHFVGNRYWYRRDVAQVFSLLSQLAADPETAAFLRPLTQLYKPAHTGTQPKLYAFMLNVLLCTGQSDYSSEECLQAQDGALRLLEIIVRSGACNRRLCDSGVFGVLVHLLRSRKDLEGIMRSVALLTALVSTRATRIAACEAGAAPALNSLLNDSNCHVRLAMYAKSYLSRERACGLLIGRPLAGATSEQQSLVTNAIEMLTAAAYESATGGLAPQFRTDRVPLRLDFTALTAEPLVLSAFRFLSTIPELRLVVDVVAECDAFALALTCRPLCDAVFDRFPPRILTSIDYLPRPSYDVLYTTTVERRVTYRLVSRLEAELRGGDARIQWAVGCGLPLTAEACNVAAEQGNLKMLKWLLSHHCPWCASEVLQLALAGDAAARVHGWSRLRTDWRDGWSVFLRLMAANQAYLDGVARETSHEMRTVLLEAAWTMVEIETWDNGDKRRWISVAAFGGRVELLQWLLARVGGFEINGDDEENQWPADLQGWWEHSTEDVHLCLEHPCVAAAAAADVRMLQWLREHCPSSLWIPAIWRGAVIGGSVAVFEWLRVLEPAVTMSDDIVRAAVRNDDVAVVEWLRGVAMQPWDPDVSDDELDVCALAADTSLPMLQCVRHLGCPWGVLGDFDWEDLSHDVKVWARAARCPWPEATAA